MAQDGGYVFKYPKWQGIVQGAAGELDQTQLSGALPKLKQRFFRDCRSWRKNAVRARRGKR